mmetsp:Transcript_36195/g.42306  ORF Transcript_36195/g.42306 Transcript_36195/m.42306 type:complete len:105 (-) Transcript_36195:66-380(-)|eukprot:CAMPEP_0176415684 /NCGR_PEP_ID=MMETSP0127-20121128/5939_1 /TAXON_ID=938130 /ORGANISM="Platyophrya macrostoma, Strain WH" /LENGTH=104 /DNA_ID=CAMNT_0017795699 /DNA_START=45 /DNA_END=359 /DNA_ORIENTATION=-
MEKVKDEILKQEEVKKNFQTQAAIIQMLQKSQLELKQLNDMAAEKVVRVKGSFTKAAAKIIEMKKDLEFIHKTVREISKKTDKELASLQPQEDKTQTEAVAESN